MLLEDFSKADFKVFYRNLPLIEKIAPFTDFFLNAVQPLTTL